MSFEEPARHYCDYSTGLGGGQGEYCWRTDTTEHGGRWFCPEHAPGVPGFDG